MPSALKSLNLGAVTTMPKTPGARRTNEYSPRSLVVAVWAVPAASRSVTVAPGSTAPVWSVTVPEIELGADAALAAGGLVWAEPVAGKFSNTAAQHSKTVSNRTGFTLRLGVKKSHMVTSKM